MHRVLGLYVYIRIKPWPRLRIAVPALRPCIYLVVLKPVLMYSSGERKPLKQYTCVQTRRGEYSHCAADHSFNVLKVNDLKNFCQEPLVSRLGGSLD